MKPGQRGAVVPLVQRDSLSSQDEVQIQRETDSVVSYYTHHVSVISSADELFHVH